MIAMLKTCARALGVTWGASFTISYAHHRFRQYRKERHFDAEWRAGIIEQVTNDETGELESELRKKYDPTIYNDIDEIAFDMFYEPRKAPTISEMVDREMRDLKQKKNLNDIKHRIGITCEANDPEFEVGRVENSNWLKRGFYFPLLLPCIFQIEWDDMHGKSFPFNHSRRYAGIYNQKYVDFKKLILFSDWHKNGYGNALTRKYLRNEPVHDPDNDDDTYQTWP